jgi:hypothetical protein
VGSNPTTGTMYKQQNTHWYKAEGGWTSDPLQSSSPIYKIHNCAELDCTELHAGSLQHIQMTTSRFMEVLWKVTIPHETIWGMAVCTCYTESWPFKTNPVTHKFECATCHKLPKYELRKCKTCSEIFLYDFWHPAFDYASPRCWDCIKNVPASQVSEYYTGKHTDFLVKLGIVPPQYTDSYKYVHTDPKDVMDSLELPTF